MCFFSNKKGNSPYIATYIKRVSLLVSLLLCVFLFKLFNPAFGINKLLFAGKEGMAF